MKKIFLPLLICAVAFSCKKDDDNNRQEDLNFPGLYTGTYTADQVPAQGTLHFSFAFNADGTMFLEGKGGDGKLYYSNGTWITVGDSIKSTYTSVNYPAAFQVTQSASLHFNNSTGALTGTWKDVAHGSNYTGSFQGMVKVGQ